MNCGRGSYSRGPGPRVLSHQIWGADLREVMMNQAAKESCSFLGNQTNQKDPPRRRVSGGVSGGNNPRGCAFLHHPLGTEPVRSRERIFSSEYDSKKGSRRPHGSRQQRGRSRTVPANISGGDQRCERAAGMIKANNRRLPIVIRSLRGEASILARGARCFNPHSKIDEYLLSE